MATFFEAVDSKLEAQLRLQRYQVHLAEEAQRDKEFQSRIKQILFDLRSKAEPLINGAGDPRLAAAAGVFAADLLHRISLTASNFHEIADKEYFKATVALLEAPIGRISESDKQILLRSVAEYTRIRMINRMFEEYQTFDNGKSKFLRFLYLLLYPLLCVVTIVGIPMLLFTKRVTAWAEGAPYRSFRIIATVNLAVKNIPIAFVQKFYEKPFTGKYPFLKEIKTYARFKEYCAEEGRRAQQNVDQLNAEIPGLNEVARTFI